MLTFFMFSSFFFLTSHHFGEIVDIVPNEILKERKMEKKSLKTENITKCQKHFNEKNFWNKIKNVATTFGINSLTNNNH